MTCVGSVVAHLHGGQKIWATSGYRVIRLHGHLCVVGVWLMIEMVMRLVDT